MTEEYKELVLKHLTGNLPQETGIVEPQFNNVLQTTNNLKTQIRAYFSSIVIYADFIPSKNNKNQDLEYSVLACYGTLIGESQTSGAFVILDKEYNIVDVITHYSDGSLIGVLYCLNVDDKGNFYAIDYVGSNYRVVLLNNLVLKPANSNTYQAIKIDVHTIPNQYTWDSMLKVFKNNGNNKYFVVGNRTDNNGIVGCELSVGDTDTWTYYTSTRTKNNSYSIFDNGYNVYWDSNSELHFEIAINYYGLIMLSKGTTSAMSEKIYILEDTINNPQSNFVFVTNKIGYYAELKTKNSQTTYSIFKIDLGSRKTTQILFDTATENNSNWLWLFKNNNGVYFLKTKKTNNENEYSTTFGLIDDEFVYEQELGTFVAEGFLNTYCYPNIITEFNKNYVYVQNQDTLFSLDFIWNKNNYNGEPYISSESLVPNIVTIEDENEHEIFNRNLYNLSSYSNWYTATAQIPNYFLNNESLYNAMLYSKANNLLTSKNIDISKNIYEELNINFINKFNIIDKETNLNNVNAGTQFVYSMLERIANMYLGKIQINYKDNTSEIKTITTKNLTYNNLKTTLKIVVYTKKLIDTINLISQDEWIIYKTINCNDLELNKYYQISQDIRIE